MPLATMHIAQSIQVQHCSVAVLNQFDWLKVWQLFVLHDVDQINPTAGKCQLPTPDPDHFANPSVQSRYWD